MWNAILWSLPSHGWPCISHGCLLKLKERRQTCETQYFNLYHPMAYPPHPDTCHISFTFAPLASMWVTALHSLFLYLDLPPPCHPPSNWLRLFSSQIFSCVSTPTFSTPAILHTYPPMKMEQTECFETSAYKIQTPGNYAEESIQHYFIFLGFNSTDFWVGIFNKFSFNCGIFY